MRLVGYLLMVLGILGVAASALMFGDIGIAALIGAVTALLSGFGFLRVARNISKIQRSGVGS